MFNSIKHQYYFKVGFLLTNVELTNDEADKIDLSIKNNWKKIKKSVFANAVATAAARATWQQTLLPHHEEYMKKSQNSVMRI